MIANEARRPFPGLRAFQPDETDLFFGRESCVDDMVDRLGRTRFLAVLGPSGSGKSSLVRTGLLDALHLGFLSAAGSRWIIADTHPGGKPMRKLACSLLASVSPAEMADADIDGMTALLRKGPRSVLKWAAAGNVPAGTNLLLLVDQFEELFRYTDTDVTDDEDVKEKDKLDPYARREEAEAFVSMLMESAASKGGSIYVVITMRSEYLGACASIEGLAETISTGLYLAPRMGRDECRQAIEGPAAVTGFRVEPALMNRMLNDLSSFAPWSGQEGADLATQLARQADQLPLMQHVLNRLWLSAKAESRGESPDGQIVLTLKEYVALKGLDGALDGHGEEIIDDLRRRMPECEARLEPVFRALVTGNSVATAVRRPCRLKELINVAGGARAEVVAIVEAFRAPDCNFLRTSDTTLDDSVIVDITHESLIRQWKRLRDWLEEEIKDDLAWRRLLAAQESYAANRGDLLSGLDFQTSQAWWESSQPTAAWAARHGGKFADAERFLQESREAEERRVEAARLAQQRERRNLLVGVGALAVGLVVVSLLGLRSVRQSHALAAQKDALALTNEKLNEKTAEADKASRMAQDQKEQAELGKWEAVANLEEANTQREKAGAAIAQQYEMLGSRNLEERNPRKALMFFTMALGAMRANGGMQSSGKESQEDDMLAGREPRNDDQLAHWLSEALIQTQGQIAFMGGADGHQGAITSSAFTPDGSVVLTSGEDRQVKMWDAKSGHLLRTLGPAASSLLSASISPHGRYVAITTEGGLGTVYELASGKVAATISPAGGGEMYDASFNADESLLATATADGIVRVWEVKFHDKPVTDALYTLKSPEAATAVIVRVAFAPDSSTVLAAEDTPTGDKNPIRKGLVRLWDYRSGKPGRTLQLDSGFVTHLVGNGKGTYLIGGPDEAQIWTPSTGAHLQLRDTKGAKTGISSAVFSHNGRLLLTSNEKNAFLWNTESGSMTHLLHGHSGTIQDIGFNVDDTLVVTASEDGTAKIWDVDGGHLKASLGAHGKISAGQFSPMQPNILVTGSDDHTAILWDWKKVFQPEATITQNQSVHDVAFSADDKLAVTAGDDGTAIIYDLAKHKEVQRLAEAKGLRVAEFSPDGSRVVTAGKGNVAEIWDVRTGKRLSNPMRHGDQVIAAHFSPDGKWLVSVGEDNVARIWKVDETAHVTPYGEYVAQQGQSQDEKRYIHDAQFSPDSKWIVFGSEDNTAAIWDVAGRKTRFILPHKNWVYTARFSSNGRRIVTASSDGTAGVWDTATGKSLYTLPGLSPLQYAGFSPDDRRIVTAGENGSASLWDAVNFKPAPLISLKSNQGTIYIAGFNSNGTLLTTASEDGKIEVWETSTGYEVFSTEENPSTNHVIFAHKDPLLLGVASSSGRSSFWRVPANHLPLAELDAKAKRLAPDEKTKELWMAELPNASTKSVTSSNQENPLGKRDRSSMLH